MAFDPTRMLVNRVPRDVTLQVNLDGEIHEIPIKIISLSWARLNQIKSQCAIFNSKTKASTFDTQGYNNTCLQEMIVEAPWGETNVQFLLQVGHELGLALEKIIPPITGDDDEDDEEEDLDETKKESSES